MLLNLKTFESVTKAFQQDVKTLGDVHTIFHAVIEEYRRMLCRISYSSDIFRNPRFKSAVLKLRRGNVSGLFIGEQLLPAPLLVFGKADNLDGDEELSFVQRLLKTPNISA